MESILIVMHASRYSYLSFLFSNRVWIRKMEFPMRRNSAKVNHLSQCEKPCALCINFINISILAYSHGKGKATGFIT